MKTLLQYLLISCLLAVALPAAAEIDTASMLAQISETISLFKEELVRLEAAIGDQQAASGRVLEPSTQKEETAPLFIKYLARGTMDAVFVPRLQACLRVLGYLNINEFTDIFGPKTEAGVTTFQKSENIVSFGGRENGQGVVGPLTRGRLNVRCAPHLTASKAIPTSPLSAPYTNPQVLRPTLAVSKDPSVPSQNISINVPNQPLGGFLVEVTGEPVVVGETVFRASRWAGSGGASTDQDITEITLQRPDGTVLAGPVSIDPNSPNIAFPTSVVYPVGATNLVLKGKLGFDYAINNLLAASSTPAVDWKNAAGQRSGRVVIPEPSSPVTGNIMTVKGPALAISVSYVPPEQAVKAPQTQWIFANYFFDLAQSAEDLRIWQWPFEYNVAVGNPTNLKECKLYDDEKALTTGANVVNPTGAASSTIFVLDNPFTFKKSIVEVLTLKCDIIAGASGRYAWGYDEISSPVAIGVETGLSAVITEYDRMGQIQTVIP